METLIYTVDDFSLATTPIQYEWMVATGMHYTQIPSDLIMSASSTGINHRSLIINKPSLLFVPGEQYYFRIEGESVVEVSKS